MIQRIINKHELIKMIEDTGHDLYVLTHEETTNSNDIIFEHGEPVLSNHEDYFTKMTELQITHKTPFSRSITKWESVHVATDRAEPESEPIS